MARNTGSKVTTTTSMSSPRKTKQRQPTDARPTSLKWVLTGLERTMSGSRADYLAGVLVPATTITPPPPKKIALRNSIRIVGNDATATVSSHSKLTSSLSAIRGPIATEGFDAFKVPRGSREKIDVGGTRCPRRKGVIGRWAEKCTQYTGHSRKSSSGASNTSSQETSSAASSTSSNDFELDEKEMLGMLYGGSCLPRYPEELISGRRHMMNYV